MFEMKDKKNAIGFIAALIMILRMLRILVDAMIQEIVCCFKSYVYF